VKFLRFGAALGIMASSSLLAPSLASASATYAQPDKAVLTSITGLDSSMSLIDNTPSGSGWINAFYSPTDRWMVGYVDAGAPLSLTWHVTSANGQPLSGKTVTLGSNLNYSNAHGTTWSAASLNTNPNGGLTQTTDANGNVTFSFSNTNTGVTGRPASLTSATAAEQQEASSLWTRLYLTVGSDIITANPNATVNQATDLIDLIVVAPTPASGTATAKTTVSMKSFTYGGAPVTATATVKGAASGTVSFSASGISLGTRPVVNGVATCSITPTSLDAGSYSLSASFSGNTVYAATTAMTAFTVAPAKTTLSMALPVTSVSLSALSTFSDVLSLSSAVGLTPPGTISLSLDGQVLTSNALSYQFSSLDPSVISVGKHVLLATYPGSVNFKASSVSRTFSVTAATTPVSTGPTNYDVSHGTLLWSETFNGASGTGLDPTIWTPEVGQYTGVAPGLANWNYGTGEIQTNTAAPANVSYDGLGNLAITAICTASNQYCGTWTSARISTAGKVNFLYGQIEARIKLPSGSYNWPAFWMLGKNFFPNGNWPNSGEIDIMEGLNHNSVDQSTLHGNYPNGGDWNGGGGVTIVAPLKSQGNGTWDNAYHNFGVLWTPTSLAFMLDGLVYGTDTYNAATDTITQTVGTQTSTFSIGGPVWPFTQPFFLILQDAIPAGTTAPGGSKGLMSVNWIHYYSYNGYGQIS